MRLDSNAGRRPRRLVLGMTATAALAVTLAACSGSGGTTASGGTASSGTAAHAATSQPAPAASSASAPASSAPAAAAATGLSGTWKGQYSGGYAGTFHLTWRQSGSRLSGTIRLSAPPTTLPINGRVQGGSISFGTLGSLAITYSGTVSGSSMSGTYQVHANGSTGGSWSAAKA
jgi:hypothetical protein